MKRGRSIILPSTDAQGLPGVYSYTRSQENHLREDYRYCTTVATVLVPGIVSTGRSRASNIYFLGHFCLTILLSSFHNF
jgi:hypothetical protein